MTPKDLPELPEPECASAYHAETLVYAAEEVLNIQREAYDLGARSTAAQPVEPTVTPTEAVVGFASWVTCRPGTLPAGEGHDAAPWSEAVHEFVVAQGWPTVRDVFPHNLKRPPLSALPAASGDSTPPSAPVQGDPSGAPRAEPEAAGQDLIDARRYRFLRDGNSDISGVFIEPGRFTELLAGQELDAVIDAKLPAPPQAASGSRGD